MQEGLAGIQKTVDMILANQLRHDQGQDQVQREAENNNGQVSILVVQGMEGNVRGQLLKNFMVF